MPRICSILVNDVPFWCKISPRCILGILPFLKMKERRIAQGNSYIYESETIMFKLKSQDGQNNICGKNLKRIRLSRKPSLSQRKLAQMLQNKGYNLDHHFIRRIESGERYVTDIELAILAEMLQVTIEELIGNFPD